MHGINTGHAMRAGGRVGQAFRGGASVGRVGQGQAGRIGQGQTPQTPGQVKRIGHSGQSTFTPAAGRPGATQAPNRSNPTPQMPASVGQAKKKSAFEDFLKQALQVAGQVATQAAAAAIPGGSAVAGLAQQALARIG